MECASLINRFLLTLLGAPRLASKIDRVSEKVCTPLLQSRSYLPRAGVEPKDEREGQIKKELNLTFLQKMAVLESRLDEIYARTVCPSKQFFLIFSATRKAPKCFGSQPDLQP